MVNLVLSCKRVSLITRSKFSLRLELQRDYRKLPSSRKRHIDVILRDYFALQFAEQLNVIGAKLEPGTKIPDFFKNIDLGNRDKKVFDQSMRIIRYINQALTFHKIPLTVRRGLGTERFTLFIDPN